MTRLIDVLNDEERVVQARIFALKEKEKTIISRLKNDERVVRARIRLLELELESRKPKVIEEVLISYGDDRSSILYDIKSKVELPQNLRKPRKEKKGNFGGTFY